MEGQFGKNGIHLYTLCYILNMDNYLLIICEGSKIALGLLSLSCHPVWVNIMNPVIVCGILGNCVTTVTLHFMVSASSEQFNPTVCNNGSTWKSPYVCAKTVWLNSVYRGGHYSIWVAVVQEVGQAGRLMVQNHKTLNPKLIPVLLVCDRERAVYKGGVWMGKCNLYCKTL